MSPKREDHLQEGEWHARRGLEHLSRKWPSSPNVYFVLLVVVLIIVLMLAYL